MPCIYTPLLMQEHCGNISEFWSDNMKHLVLGEDLPLDTIEIWTYCRWTFIFFVFAEYGENVRIAT